MQTTFINANAGLKLPALLNKNSFYLSIANGFRLCINIFREFALCNCAGASVDRGFDDMRAPWECLKSFNHKRINK
jgi:hypothetical protein